MGFLLDLEIDRCPVGKNKRFAENSAETGENFRLGKLLPGLNFQEHILVFAQIISYAPRQELASHPITGYKSADPQTRCAIRGDDSSKRFHHPLRGARLLRRFPEPPECLTWQAVANVVGVPGLGQNILTEGFSDVTKRSQRASE